MNGFTQNLLHFSNNQSLETLFLRLNSGGLVQIRSKKGGSKTWLALSLLDLFLKTSNNSRPLFIWISDESILFPEAIYNYWKIPLSQIVLVNIKEPNNNKDNKKKITDAWRVTLESIQSGLFSWVLLHTSRPCHPNYLRKVQLDAERFKTRVLLLCSDGIPHWVLKIKIEVEGHLHHENPIFSKQQTNISVSRGLPMSNS